MNDVTPRTPPTAVIMAAGRGSRLLPLTLEIPKCLLEVGGKPILAHQISVLYDIGIRKFEVITGHGDPIVRKSLADMDAEINFTCNENYASTNSLYSLGCSRTEPGPEGLILLNSDVLFHRDIAKMLLNDRRENVLMADFQSSLGDEEMKITIDTDYRVTGISKSIASIDGQAENTGRLKVGREAAIRMLETARDPARLKTLTWVPDSIHSLRHDLDFHVLSIGNSPWIEIDFPEDLEMARRQGWPRLAPASLG